VRLIDYANVPRSIGTVVSRRLATLHELDTVYGTADLHDMIEIIAVDAHNQRLANQTKG
jgi:4-diphosphocytidyl-2C-methyl-D-erythritol kinase